MDRIEKQESVGGSKEVIKKVRNVESKAFHVEKKQLSILVGGGGSRNFTLLEAAEWFAKQYLPKDLTSVSVRFPCEKIDYGLEIQCPNLSAAEWDKKLKTMPQEDKGSFKVFSTHYAGSEAEYEMWKYLNRLPETSITAILHNYNVKQFCLLSAQEFEDQEFDFIVIFAEHRKYVHVEVKAGRKGAKGWVEQLEKGRKFFTKLIDTIGVDEYKDWEYIPVGAFPNASTQSEVISIFFI